MKQELWSAVVKKVDVGGHLGGEQGGSQVNDTVEQGWQPFWMRGLDVP